MCGLAAEARIARRTGFSVVVGAGDPGRTAELVERAVPRASLLISFGIAGALAPQLRPGDVVLSGRVVSETLCWPGSDDLRDRLARLAGAIGAVEGPVLGASAILATRADKHRARTQTGALAVDLESAVVARLAAAADMPFVVLRTIADPAGRDLPAAALVPLSSDGTPRLMRVFSAGLRRPQQLGALFGLACETRRALAALERPARALREMLAGL